jgi:hypothetical protein
MEINGQAQFSFLFFSLELKKCYEKNLKKKYEPIIVEKAGDIS